MEVNMNLILLCFNDIEICITIGTGIADPALC